MWKTSVALWGLMVVVADCRVYGFGGGDGVDATLGPSPPAAASPLLQSPSVPLQEEPPDKLDTCRSAVANAIVRADALELKAPGAKPPTPSAPPT